MRTTQTQPDLATLATQTSEGGIALILADRHIFVEENGERFLGLRPGNRSVLT